NNPRDFAKPVKAIALPQDVPSTSDRRLIELETQVQCLMEAHLAPTQPTQVNKITTSCEICGGPHDTQYCMKDPEQAFVEYASSCTDKAREEKGNLGNTNSNPRPQPDPLASIAIEQVRKLSSMLESLGLVPRSSNAKFIYSKGDDGEVMFIEIIRDDDEPRKKGLNEGEGATTKEPAVEYFDTFPTRDELTYHRYLMSGLIPSIFLSNPIITEGCPPTLRYHATLGMCISKKLTLTLTPLLIS
ncbi:hypothetical protein Tco_1061861, partial [Tanacetum coccineum]